MAEYYPLLSRAVAGLRDAAPAARQTIYGRARQALIGQLRGMQPPVPEEAISKEITALDEAIARLEAEMAPPPSISDAASAAVAAALLEPSLPQSLLLETKPPEAPAPDPQPAVAPSGAGAAPAESGAVAVGRSPSPVRPAAPPTPRVGISPMQRPDRPVFAPRPNLPSTRSARPNVAPAAPQGPVEPPAHAAPASAPLPEAGSLPVAPTLDTVRIEPDGDVGAAQAPDIAVHAASEDGKATAPAFPNPGLEAPNRDDAIRPAMPRQVASQPRDIRVWIVAVAALAAVAAIALSAWKLRDRPEELARTPTPIPQAESQPGKIVERADGGASPEEDAADIATPVAGGSAAATTSGAPQAATPVPAQGAGTVTQPASDQAIPVSYKAAVLVAAPETPEKVKTFVGSVVWRMETVNAGQNQPVATAVRADVDVPDAKLQMTMEIRKNTEAQFPASHTMDVKFTPAPGSSLGDVKQIDVPQMRREDAPTGDPLIGVPVTITNNSFLVGLTRGEAEARNIEAMRGRGWFDVPLVLVDGRPAKITFEKGASGDRILSDALAAWSKN